MFSFLKKSKTPPKEESTPLSQEQKNTKPFDYYLDCRNMLCPRPIFELSQKVKQIDEGIIKVECRDDGFPSDMNAWTNRMKLKLELLKENDIHIAYITLNNQ